MRITQRTLREIFDILKHRIAENSMTIQEISLNTNISEERLSIILDDNTEVVQNISDLFEFFKYNLSATENKFTPYKIFKKDTQMKITRIIAPKCSMYYDQTTQKFYRFKFKSKKDKAISETTKQLIINEMAKEMKKYLKKY